MATADAIRLLAVEAAISIGMPEATTRIEAAVRSAVAAEREACAKIADEHSAWTRSFGAEEACEMVAKAIRARSNTAG